MVQGVLQTTGAGEGSEGSSAVFLAGLDVPPPEYLIAVSARYKTNVPVRRRAATTTTTMMFRHWYGIVKRGNDNAGEGDAIIPNKSGFRPFALQRKGRVRGGLGTIGRPQFAARLTVG
jgi:hypothetical protein